MKVGAMVLVDWDDSALLWDGSYWNPLEDARSTRPVRVQSLGFVVKHTKRRLVLAQSVNSGAQAGAPFAIPTASIRSITEVS